MEGFLSINWDKPVDESISFFPKDVFNQSSAAYHSLHGISQSAWSSDENKSQEKSKATNDKWNPCHLKREILEGVGGQGQALKVHSPVNFPRCSVLGPFEQRDYFHAILRVTRSFNSGTPVEPTDVLRIRELQMKLKDELNDFQLLAQNTVQKNPSIYSILNTGIGQFVGEIWKAQLECVKLYPPLYKLIGNVTLIPKENLKKVDLTLEFTALELGRVPAPIFPPLNSLIKLQRRRDLMIKRFHPSKIKEAQKELVSKDLNAVKLAKKYEVDISVSSNALRVLAGNIGPLFRNSWDIPFSVQEMEIKGEIKTVLFIDDPLPPLEMTAIEKNTVFNSFAVKFQFFNQNRSRYHVYHSQEKSKTPDKTPDTPVVKEDDLFGAPDIDQLETFGVEAPTISTDEIQKKREKTGNPSENKEPGDESPTQKQVKVPAHVPVPATDSDSSDNSSLVIDTGSVKHLRKSNRKEAKTCATESDSSELSLAIDTGSDCDQSPKKKMKTDRKGKNLSKQSSETFVAPSNLLNVILQDQQKMMQSNRKPFPKGNSALREPENPQDYIPPKQNQNVTYRIWALRANEKSLRLLIRSSLDTALVTPNGEFRSFVMVPKVEYQPWFGAECLTPREMNEQWMDLYLRPESRLFRVRLDAYTGDLFSVEQKDIDCLESEINFQYGDQIKPANCLHNIWAVLSSLSEIKLKQGSYLLRHGFHDGICVQIWNSTDEQGESLLNLHETYTAVDTTLTVQKDVSDNWLALDPWTMFPAQRALGRPPLTFEPGKENYKELNKMKKLAGKKKKTGNQGKKPPATKKGS